MTRLKVSSVVCLALLVIPILFPLCARADDDPPPAQLHSDDQVIEGKAWLFRLPKDEKVVYRGVASFDGAGLGSGTFMYPAPSAIGFIAAIAAHAAVVGSEKSDQKTKLQQTADQVLIPYQSVLNGYKYRDLMQLGVDKMSTIGSKKLIEFSDKVAGTWLIESSPIFSMTQDQSAIILDSAILIHSPTAPSVAAYQNAIRIVSRARTETDLPGFWTANDGEKLKEESAILFAESIDIALSEMANAPVKSDNAYKTYRYFEGGTEKMERAQPIREGCGRTVIRTLRGWIMSIPVETTGESCQPVE